MRSRPCAIEAASGSSEDSQPASSTSVGACPPPASANTDVGPIAASARMIVISRSAPPVRGGCASCLLSTNVRWARPESSNVTWCTTTRGARFGATRGERGAVGHSECDGGRDLVERTAGMTDGSPTPKARPRARPIAVVKPAGQVAALKQCVDAGVAQLPLFVEVGEGRARPFLTPTREVEGPVARRQSLA